MWRLFPPDADRPWRQVFVMVDHELRVRLRSWWFRALLLGLPVGVATFSVAATLPSQDPPAPVLFVVPDATVRTHYAEHAGHQVVVAASSPEREEGYLAVVHVEGTDPIAPVVRATWVDIDEREEAERITKRVVERVRRTIVLADLDAAIAAEWERSNGAAIDAASVEAEVADLSASAQPFSWLIGVCLGCWFGAALSVSVHQGRATNEASVLRIGTPPLVLWIGCILQGITIYGTVAFAFAALPAMLFAVQAIFAAPDPEFNAIFGPLALRCSALMGGGMFLGTVCWAGVTSGTKGATDGVPAGWLLSLPTVASPLLLAAWLFQGDPVDHLPSALAWTPAPMLGPGMALYAMKLGASPLWLVGSLLIQVPFGLLALRFGGWGYGLDEPAWERFVRLRRARGSTP